MPKSRGRKARKQPKARVSSGDPRRRMASASVRDALPLEWRVFLGAVAEADLSDPVMLPSLPALYLNAIVSSYRDVLPEERCVDDCLVLAHACAQFGIEAQVRTAVLTVTDTATGARETHGSVQPQWADGMLHGHTVVWLPEPGLLIDPTAEQYDGIDAYREGPVIALTQGDSVSAVRTADTQDRPRVTTSRGSLRLRYQLGTLADARSSLDHPVVHGEGDGHQRRGVNVASEVAFMLATQRPESEIEAIPYTRAVALLRALRQMNRQEDENRDVLFRHVGPGPLSIDLVRLDEAPSVAPVN